MCSANVEISPGDDVIIRNEVRDNKLSTKYSPEPLVVTSTKGSMITALKQNDGKGICRNSSCFKKIAPQSLPNQETPDDVLQDFVMFDKCSVTEQGKQASTQTACNSQMNNPSVYNQLSDQSSKIKTWSGRVVEVPKRYIQE